MAKKTQPSTPPLTQDQLRDELVNYAFTQIVKDGQQLLTVFDTGKYRSVVTVDHADNDRYPNLVKEALTFFWNLTLSKTKNDNLVIYFTYDKEASTKFGTMIYNNMLRSIFKHTMKDANDANIEDCVRVSTNTKELNYFFYNRLIEGESEAVTITALDHVAT